MKDKKPIKRSSAQMFQPVAVPESTVSHDHGCGDTTVNVTVTVNEKEEGEVTGCLKSLFGCAKKAAK